MKNLTEEQYAKIEKIENEINNNYNDDIYEDEIIVDGIKFLLHSESESDEIKETLSSVNYDLKIVFERTGHKNYSYDSWVDTSWGLWR